MCEHCEGSRCPVESSNQHCNGIVYIATDGSLYADVPTAKYYDGYTDMYYFDVKYCPWCGRKLTDDEQEPQHAQGEPRGYLLTSNDLYTIFGTGENMDEVNDLIIQELDERRDHEGTFQLFPLFDKPKYLNVVLERKVTFR